MASSQNILNLIDDLLHTVGSNNGKKHDDEKKKSLKWRKSQLLVSGFINHKNKLYMEIIVIICKYYPSITIYGYGGNARGEYGIGDSRRLEQFELLQSMTNLCNFADNVYGMGYVFMIINKITNDIYCSGSNINGQCFISDKAIKFVHTFSKLPDEQQIDLSDSIISNGMSSQHVLLIDKNHEFYGFGNNMWGQIGDDHDGIASNEYAAKLRRIDMLNTNFPYSLREKVICIGTGRQHSLILLENGDVYGIGICNEGQLGIEPNQDECDEGILNPVKIDGLHNIYQICCGHSHNLCLDKANNLYVFGSNNYGQLGLGHNTTPINKPVLNNFFNFLPNKTKSSILIECGWSHSMLIDLNEKMDAFTFGNNANGEIGNKSKDKKFVSIPYKIPMLEVIDGALGMYKTALITATNDLYITGYCNENYIKYEPELISKQEIGIATHDYIVRVICCDQTVLVIVNTQ